MTGNHGDKYPFDGPVGVLAHAFYPRSGEVHFDNEEDFTQDSDSGVNLRYTASHEFGHTLGLKHSLEKGTLMSPYHPGYYKKISLKEDDLVGISKLFKLGKGAVYTADTVEAREYRRYLRDKFENSQDSKPHVENSACIEDIDAVIHHPHTQTLFFFTKHLYYKVERDKVGEMGVVTGYPKQLSEGWDGLEDNIDAAYVNTSISAAFFFKGEKYWKYDFVTEKMFKGFPKVTMVTSPNIPSSLRATMMSGNVAYFFSQDKIVKHRVGSNSYHQITEKKVDVEATFPLFVKGYFGMTHGSTYSIYKVKTMEAVEVYDGRPLSWDYGLPMCMDSLTISRDINPKMKPFCEAYAYLAFGDADLEIPKECYSLVRPFPAYPLQDIIDLQYE